jgi:hypothetical protein
MSDAGRCKGWVCVCRRRRDETHSIRTHGATSYGNTSKRKRKSTRKAMESAALWRSPQERSVLVVDVGSASTGCPWRSTASIATLSLG